MKLKTIAIAAVATVAIGAITKTVFKNYEREIEEYKEERRQEDKNEIYCAVTEIVTKLMISKREDKEFNKIKRKKAIITNLEDYREYKIKNKEIDMA